MSWSRRAGATILMYAVLTFLVILWLYPLWVALSKSLAIGGWDNYTTVLNHPVFHYWKAIGNSALMAGGSTLVIVAIASLGGFAFSKMRFRGRETLYRVLLATMAVPVAAVVTPLFFTVNSFGLRDTYIGVILPLIAFNTLMMLMMMRSHFDSLPDELFEATRLDGCGYFGAFIHVMLPLSGPAMANVGVLSFVYTWNEFLLPSLLLRSAEKLPVTVAISLLQTDRMSQEQIAQMYSGLVLMTIPSVLVYLFSQRYLQAGITAGAVKS